MLSTYSSTDTPPLPSIVTTPEPDTAILDSGCSHHFITPSAPSTNHQPNTEVHVQLPDGTTVSSTHNATLDLHPSLPSEAQQSFIIPNLQNSLLSIGQFCDADCTATFNKHTARIDYKDNTVIIGHRSRTTKLWHINLPTPSNDTTHYINNAFRPNSTIRERIAYYHACCFSPSLSTWCKAIDAGHFSTWQIGRAHV